MKRRQALWGMPALLPALVPTWLPAWLPVLAAGFGTPAAQAQAGPAQKGERVTWPADVRLLDGQPWQPPAGHAVIVVVWSTTCPFCQRHNVHVEKLYRSLTGRPVTVLGVARESDAAAVRQHMARRGWTFPVTLAWREVMTAVTRRQIIPQTITVDRQGRLQEVIPGEMTEDDVMRLAPPAPPPDLPPTRPPATA